MANANANANANDTRNIFSRRFANTAAPITVTQVNENIGSTTALQHYSTTKRAKAKRKNEKKK